MSEGQRLVPAGAVALQPALALHDANCVWDAVRKEDLTCAICLETLSDPFVTACGHTFCYACLTQSLQHNKHCPACSHYLTTDLIYPNFLLSKIVKRVRSRALGTPLSPLELLQHSIADHRAALGEEDVDALLQQLWEHKQVLQQQQREASMELLLHFLHSSRQDKVQRLVQLQQELHCLDSDIQHVEAAGTTLGGPRSSHQARPATPRVGPPAPEESTVAASAGGAGQAHDVEMESRERPDGAFAAAQQVQQQGAAAQAAAAAVGHDVAAAGVAAAVALGQQGLHHHQLFHQQQQQAVQQVAKFANATFAGLAVQAFADGGSAVSQSPHALLLPGMLSAAGATVAATQPQSHQQQQQQQQLHHHQHQQPHKPYSSLLGSLLSPGSATSSAGGGYSSGPGGQRDVLSLLRNKKRRIATQFDDLQQCYLQLRANRLRAACGGSGEGMLPGDAGAGEAWGTVGALIDEGLQEFSHLLSVITRCNKLKLVVEIPRPPLRQSTSTISSLEFDKDGALFATAGVSKCISIFEFASVLPTPPSHGLHTPVVELVSRSKLSCLSWNKYTQEHIASSDYEGVVSVWDISTSGLLLEYEAHSQRIWSVDFCEANPSLLASGSDDCAVKVWSTQSPSSVAQIDTKANVCSVRWRPGSAHELAVGSADHGVYLYDLRRTAVPLVTYRGHRKAVSYVRFSDASQLVSASTDSTLRLWGLGGPGGASEALRVYEGHSNEKNFVGLAVDGDFLACGSETSDLYVYYKALSKPVAQQAFAMATDGNSNAQNDKAFISAACWRPGAQNLLAANNIGTVKVFSLTGSQA